jgi:hypothetical protein
MEMKKIALAFGCLVFLLPISVHSAGKDTVYAVLQPYHRNVIKFNPTPMILWDWRNITFSYERILSPRHTISAELGYLVMPKLFGDTVINMINLTSSWKHGISAAIEYRFYLTKLSTRPVPAGLYVGGYLSFYGYEFKNNFDVVGSSSASTGSVGGRYWAVNLGVQLGYQFVFWKRLTVDMVLLGPGISYYGGTTEINGDLTAAEVEQLHGAFCDQLENRFPVVNYLSPNGDYHNSGTLDIVRFGFRYLIQIGILF